MIARIPDEDKTLVVHIYILFEKQEEEITFTSIFTTLGIISSALMLTLTGGNRDDMSDIYKEKKRVLTRLAIKTAIAHPGSIGSTISWFLSLLIK